MLDHVILTVEDVERSVAFYKHALKPLEITEFTNYRGKHGSSQPERLRERRTFHLLAEGHEGPFLGIAPTHRAIHFETVDVMRVQNGKITDHWGVGNLLSLMQQIGGWMPPPSAAVER